MSDIPMLNETPVQESKSYVALSELADERFSFGDLFRILPAMIISIGVNFGLLFGLVMWNDSLQASLAPNAYETTRIPASDNTVIDTEPPEEKAIDTDFEDNFMDQQTPKEELQIASSDEKKPEEPMVAAGNFDKENLPENAQGGFGIPMGEVGIKGADIPNAAPGLQGLPIANANMGALSTTGGTLGVGDAVGLMTGKGGGSSAAGGFGLRGGDTTKTALAHGGTEESQKAVARALLWLAKHQSANGRWSLDNYAKDTPNCTCDSKLSSRGANHDTAGTAMALLCFLGAGHHHKNAQSPYAQTVRRALDYLKNRQDAKGYLQDGMYAHSLATIAVCEAYALTGDDKYKPLAQGSINFLVDAQNKSKGGWRYAPKSDADTSVTGWAVMGLRSGQMAGLNVPTECLENCRRYLDSCSYDNNSQYGYTAGGRGSHAMTAAGLLCRQYLGWGPRNPDLQRGCDFLVKHMPPTKTKGKNLGAIYYYYYATQVLHHMAGQEQGWFERWNPVMRDFLIDTQVKEDANDHRHGSWNPDGSDHGGAGGRIYSTALACLTLEVYYRHLPLYRRMDKDR